MRKDPMMKDMAKMKEWSELTEKYISTSSSLLGEVSDHNTEMAQAMVPPLKVLKFFNNSLDGMLSQTEPKRASIGIDGDGGMYTVPDNVVSINSGKKRAERWSTTGTVRLIELE